MAKIAGALRSPRGNKQMAELLYLAAFGLGAAVGLLAAFGLWVFVVCESGFTLGELARRLHDTEESDG